METIFFLFSNVVNHDVNCLQILVVWWCFSRKLGIWMSARFNYATCSNLNSLSVWDMEIQCIQYLCRNNQNYNIYFRVDNSRKQSVSVEICQGIPDKRRNLDDQKIL